MSVSGPTDENAPAPGSAVSTDGDDGPDARVPEDVTAENPADVPPVDGGAAGDVAETRPCAYCGRPVTQPGKSSPAVRYCPDNDGACAQAAAERRRLDQDSPGLAGQVARTW